MLNVLWDTTTLFIIGICGSTLFWLLRFPVPSLLGTLALLGTLRTYGIELPYPPDILSVLVSSMLGLSVGARITRDTVRKLKEITLPALIIITWALIIVFVFGYFLAKTTYLDIYTSILSSSMGGVAEMTLVAMDTEADVPIVVIMLMSRVFITAITFPIILRYMVKKQGGKVSQSEISVTQEKEGEEKQSVFASRILEPIRRIYTKLLQFNKGDTNQILGIIADQKRWLLTYGISVLGGLLFTHIGVPAGALVGSILITATISILGFYVKPTSSNAYSFMLIGLGIVITSNINQETIKSISADLLLPMIISLTVIYLTSFFVASVICRITGWDFPTCFLASAPSGLTTMTGLAISFGLDPFRVSLLHLCRLIVLKTVVPLVFMFFS